ncbi:hypothetical protein BDW71DRAFT_215073 [Aspergillus fruticulosus]
MEAFDDNGEHRPQPLLSPDYVAAFEPVAIVGMAVRLPGGVHSTPDFWDMLINKRDGRCEVPETRYNIDGFQHPTKNHSIRSKHGYFLKEDPAMFDTAFFSIPPLEAERMDPQQRLLLEVTWECLESAGETDCRGKLIGCYVGVFGEDWLELACKDTENIDRYRALGTGSFALANRISYEYDLRGPSITVETGCSASLVGLHEACQALQAGTCSAALVAGTNLILGPSMTTTMTDNGVLSPEGICRTFDEKANGYGRGEAINAVYIKPLSAAIRDGNPIRAVIRATGTNFDGRTPNITSPHAESQEALIRSTYARAGIRAIEDTALFECHGTATTAGDTVEASVVAKLVAGHGALIGAAKPNVGHSEGASGLTSLIKAALALEKKIIPPNAHFETPNPSIPFVEGKLTVPVEPTPWPSDRAERISVNSFGIGGSNVHVILESATKFVPLQRTLSDAYPQQPKVLLVSARGVEGLKRRIAQTGDYANQREASEMQNLAYTLAMSRRHLPHRAFAVARPSSPIDPSMFQSSRALKDIHLTFVFTGQGAQWAGMGRDLMASSADFRSDIQEMDRILKNLVDGPEWSLLDELNDTGPDSRVNEAEFSQPLCTALQIALVNILTRRFGIQPSAVVGHSSGEIAAAYASGAITMKTAIIIAYLRGKVASSLEGIGGMAAIGLGRATVAPYLTSSPLVIACENSPQSVTLAGADEAIEDIIKRIRKDRPDAFCQRLRVTIPYHSPEMKQIGIQYESMLEPYMESMDGPTIIPLFSTVHGEVVRESRQLSAKYWRQNLESAVLFSAAIQLIMESNEPMNHIFLEIGPNSVLAGPCNQTAKMVTKKKSNPVYIPTLQTGKSQNGFVQLLESVATAHCHGVSVDLKGLVGSGKVLTDLPTYPWHHEKRYWLRNRMITDWRMRTAPHHELLGARVTDLSDLEPSWRNLFYREDVEWLEEHVLGGEVVFPGAGYVSMAGEAVRQLHPEGDEGYSVRKMVLKTALILKERHQTELITSLKPVRLNDTMNSDWYTFTIASHDGIAWTTHCHGEVRPQFDYPPRRLTSGVPRYSRKVNAERWYQSLKNRGLEYGGRFRGLADITADPTERASSATVTDKPELHESRYTLHPIVIDQCLQATSVAWANGTSRRLEGMGIPVAFEHLYVKGSADTMTVAVRVAEMGKGKQLGEATLVGPEGETLLAADEAYFFSVDEQLMSSAYSIPLASHMRWLPDIDMLPKSSLTHMRPIKEETNRAFRSLIIGTQLAIVRTNDRLKEVEPTLPHMVKWKNWLAHEAALIHQAVSLTPEMLEFARMTPVEQDEALRRRAAEYLDTDWRAIGEAVLAVYENCAALAVGETTGIDVLMANEGLKTYYYNGQELSDWSRFLPILGHNNPRLRVIEIGAGTGAATACALKLLQTHEGVRLYSQYYFTDISPGFMVAAQEQFQHHDGIEYKVLDITKDPQEQGFVPHTFDLVIASNVLHATPILRETLQRVHQLLVPNGWLLLHELHTDLKVTNFLMGTLPGWWLGAEDGRPDAPYVSPERWDQELRAVGFTGNESLAYDVIEPATNTFTMLTRVAPYHDPSGEVVKVGNTGHFPDEVALLSNDEHNPWAQDVATQLRNAGFSVQWVSWDDTPTEGQCIISLVDIEGPFLYEMDEARFRVFNDFLQRLDKQRLFWVTPATEFDGCDVDPRYALVHGVARTLRLETVHHPVTIEIGSFDKTAAWALVQILNKVRDRQIQRPDLKEEYEFAIIDGTVYIRRCHWLSPADLLPNSPQPEAIRKLGIGTYGLIDTLRWVESELPQVEKTDVEVEVRYASLNFRDLMVAMGVVGAANELGVEGSGVVRRVGDAVTELKPGDEVVVGATGMFRTHIVVNQQQCKKLTQEGQQINLEEAATMPSVYATALWVFSHLANLRKGQSVLIHSACGGVGLASIHVCQELGAKIFATVGSEEKAQYLVENFGIPRNHIFHSRNTSFLPDLMRETGGRGADIVLNSLAGKLLHASWACVAEYGKMFELGKRDFLTHGTLSMTPFLKNRAFFSVDMIHLQGLDDRQLHEELQQQIEDWKKEGKIVPIRPVKVFNAVDVVEAFRYMQGGTHMGKILIKMPESAALLPCETREAEVVFAEEDAYLLVGGMGGIGKAVATWMRERGARHFIFLSRSAGISTDSQEFIAELQGQGCTATAVAGSVTHLPDIQRALAQCDGRRLAGVLQLSMVLRDQLFAKMTFEEWNAALAPKVQGAWNLHHALKDTELDFFVLFGSSICATGNNGQANYAAANCFVDAFARYRRQQGFPCSVLHLGPVEEIGMLSRDAKILQRARDFAVRLVQESEVMRGLALAIRQSPVDSSTRNSPCSSFIGLGTSKPTADPMVREIWDRDARFDIYYSLEATGEVKMLTNSDRARALVARVEADPGTLNDPETELEIMELTCEMGKQYTEHMSFAADKDDEQIADMAIDSLMAIEIKGAVRRNLGIDVSLVEISRAGTVRGLSQVALSHLKVKYQQCNKDDVKQEDEQNDD